MSETVTIDFKGIMVLSFHKDTTTNTHKCVIGIPHTDAHHQFKICYGEGKERPIGVLSQIYILDDDDQRRPANVSAPCENNLFDALINFKEDNFHGNDLGVALLERRLATEKSGVSPN